MADQITFRSDIARSMYIGTKQVFKDTLKKNKREEWKSICKVVPSDKMEETYDTIGNLKPATEKVEGDPLEYGKIIEGHRTTIKNKTFANGFSVTMESKEDEKWGIVPIAKTQELARTILQLRERKVAQVWDNVTTSIGADGVALAATNHPLINKAGEYNDNLIEKVFDTAAYEEANTRFNHWKNHAGEKFDTLPTSMIAHRDRQTNIMAMLESQLVAFENSNTKNTIPKLKTIFNRYINQLQVHLVDDGITSVILQRRKGLVTEYDYDKRHTFNFYFNVHERYETGCINPGFGFVTITGEAGA